jgi:hypothetical protein
LPCERLTPSLVSVGHNGCYRAHVGVVLEEYQFRELRVNVTHLVSPIKKSWLSNDCGMQTVSIMADWTCKASVCIEKWKVLSIFLRDL